jgi:hypothetical protein
VMMQADEPHGLEPHMSPGCRPLPSTGAYAYGLVAMVAVLGEGADLCIQPRLFGTASRGVLRSVHVVRPPGAAAAVSGVLAHLANSFSAALTIALVGFHPFFKPNTAQNPFAPSLRYDIAGQTQLSLTMSLAKVMRGQRLPPLSSKDSVTILTVSARRFFMSVVAGVSPPCSFAFRFAIVLAFADVDLPG